MIDEPGLTAAYRAGATAEVWDAVRAVAPAWGLHVCGAVPWRLIDAAEPDAISYDLVRYGCDHPAQIAVRRLMRRGGRIMWGAVDPAAVGFPALAAGRVCAAARAVAGRQWRTADVLGASLLSGTCGSGGVDAEAERQLAGVLETVACLLRGGPGPHPASEPVEPLRAAPPQRTGSAGRGLTATSPQPDVGQRGNGGPGAPPTEPTRAGHG